MNVVVNGFPKSGTHALWKACYLLGVNAEHGHWDSSMPLPQGTTHHLLVKRDPRNVICSWLRFRGLPVTSGTFISWFRDQNGIPFVEQAAKWEPLLTNLSVHLLRYEDLVASDAELRGLAQYLGVPYLEDAFSNLDGHTMTWNAVKSDYRSIWTPEVEAVWQSEGGAELLQRWGYG
jgi:hypothetical protein